MTRRTLPAALLLLAAWTASAEGQPVDAHVSVLAGVQGTDPELHGFVGIGGGYRVTSRLGAEGVALLGAGGGYRSGLAGAGPSVVLLDAARAQVRLWGGPAWYRESLSSPEGATEASDAVRTMTAGMAGLTVRAPMGPVALTGGVVYWAGRLDEAGFQAAETVHGFRLTLGLGR